MVDKLVRGLARSFLLKYIDGYKTNIFRIVQLINSALIAAFLLCPHLPPITGIDACSFVENLNGQWLGLSVILGQLGLEFGIKDAKIKAKQQENEY